MLLSCGSTILWLQRLMKGAIVRLARNSGGASLMPLLRQHAHQRAWFSVPLYCKERDLYASNFSRRARDSTLGADSLPGVGLPDPIGHLSAGISDRRFPLWRCDL